MSKSKPHLLWMGSEVEEEQGFHASLLGELIDSINHLTHRVKLLEESQAMEHPSDDAMGHWLPEIEARVYNNQSMLLRLHCMKRKRLLVKVLYELDNFNLNVVSVNVVPFGDSLLHIIIVAEMNQEFLDVLSAQDITAALQSALREDTEILSN